MKIMQQLLLAGLCWLSIGAVQAVDVFNAARGGDIDALQAYHEQGGDLNVANPRGHTPFILAAYYDQPEVMHWLKQAGADVCAVDEQGSNAFMGVAFRGYDHLAEWLLEHTDCGVNYQNYAGQTALMMAALFGREAMIETLLEAGADPEIRDFQGNTAASLAQAQGLSAVAETLRTYQAVN